MHANHRWLLALAFCVLFTGCSKSTLIKVHGKVTRNGEVIKKDKPNPNNVPAMMIDEELVKVDDVALDNMENLSITLYPVVEKKDDKNPPEFYWANVKPDGSYEVQGKDGKGIPPGKYRIAVTLPTVFTNVDKFRGAFGPTNSKIIRDVEKEPTEQEINIDLAKPEG